MWKLHLLCALLFLALPSASAEDGDTCELTGFPPQKSHYLSFCTGYNDPGKSCCIPGHDNDIAEMFDMLIDGLGPGCKNPKMYPTIREYYCLGCEPHQPKYTVYDEDNDEQVYYICESFAHKLWGVNGSEYNECGLMKMNPCLDILEDFDPYSCGDDVIIPSQYFTDPENCDKIDADGQVDAMWCFLNFFKPPGLEDFRIEVMGGGIDEEAMMHCYRGAANRFSTSLALLVVSTTTLYLMSWSRL